MKEREKKMRNYKLFGLLIIMLWGVALALVVIGCVNMMNTWLCITLVGIGVLVAYISEGLIYSCEGWSSEKVK